MDETTELLATVLKTLSNPRRLAILHRLAQGPCEVGRLALELDISQPNASQHLALMRAVGLVETERIGREIRYRLSDPEVMTACSTMQCVLERRLRRLGQLAPAADINPDQLEVKPR